ncbi:MAG: cystathionine gamma-synthase [Proteobacteria bacterium]|nr:MAG: cystathionine gamma-synthase [Pseudomonadota bacterium]
MSDEGRHDEQGLATRAVHAGTGGRQPYASLQVPVVRTSTYTFEDSAEIAAHFAGDIDRIHYGRYGNPTVAAAEAKLAALDGAAASLLMASGMAAITTTLLSLLSTGDHLVVTSDCYGRTRRFCNEVLGRMGVAVSVVPVGVAQIAAAIRDDTRVVYTESPTNPFMQVVDLPALAAATADRDDVVLLVDSTLATPVNQRPLTQGADLVLHSATKYLGGHNDLLGGVLSGSAALVGAVRELHGTLGAVLDPHAAWLLLRGLKTLPLRVRAQNATALRLARTLQAHPKVRQVWYPGLESHAHHATAVRLMSGFGGVVTVELDADFDATSRFVDRVGVFHIGPSLGGVESLIEQSAKISYARSTREERYALGVVDGLVRLAVGIEDADDLEAALLTALDEL